MKKFLAVVIFTVGTILTIWGVLTVIDLEVNGISAGEVLGTVSVTKHDELTKALK